MERVNERIPRANNGRIVIGLVLITLAGLIFADNFDIMPHWIWHDIIFSLPMLLVVIGLISLVKNESRTTGIVLLAVGGFFLTARLLELPYSNRQIFLPAILAVIGILILVKHKNHHHLTFSGNTEINTEDFIDDVAIFGGSEQKVKSKNFKGGRITNIFGGSSFDMLDAQLAPGSNYIDVFCMFGGSKFIVPADWKVRVDVTSIFGGFSDKRKSISTSETSFDRELVIKGMVIFGGGEVKNL